MKIRVAITDDHPTVRSGLETMLHADPEIEVITSYASGNALMAGLQKEQPDILLLDIHLPDIPGNELIKIVSEKYPAVQVIILSGVNSAFLIKSLYNSGAKGYLLKTSGQEQLITAIKQVAGGAVYLSPDIKDILSQNALKNKPGISYNEDLTEREKEILQLISEEYTSQQISEKMHLSPRTIESYRLGLMQKLEVKNIAGLIKKAIFMGIIK